MDLEGDLAERLRAGEQRAFELVYDRLADRVYAFAMRLTGRREAADEIFQHAWLRLAEAAPRLAIGTNLLAWLLTVARNHWRSQHRRASTHGRHEDALVAAQPSPPGPDVSLERRALIARLERALSDLPEAHREVLVVVAEADDVPQHELARILGLTPAAFRKRLSRARHALGELLEIEEAS